MISLFINELPTLSAFNDNDRVLIDSTYTLAAEMSTVRDYVLTSRVIPTMSATNLVVSNLSALSATFTTIDVINYELSGFTVTGTITAEEYQYGSQERPSFYGIKQALDSFLYLVPSLTSTRVNNNDTLNVEVGTTISDPVITYDTNKIEKKAIIGFRIIRPGGLPATNTLAFNQRSYTDANNVRVTSLPENGSITFSTSAWTVSARDWTGASTQRTCEIRWYYEIYYGAYTGTNASDLINTPSNIINASFLKAEGFAFNGRSDLGRRSVDAGTGAFIYVAYPARFGAISQILVNDFANTEITRLGPVGGFSFTNASGGTGLYTLYIINNRLFGSYNIQI